MMIIWVRCSPTWSYLSSKASDGAMAVYINKMRAAKMKISTTVICYHYETRTSGTGKNRKTKRVRVNSHRVSEAFNYEYCLDRTPAGIVAGDFNVVRVDSRVEYEWGNNATRQAFLAQGQR